MALEKILKNSSGVPTGEYERIAGGTLWADSPIGTILAYGGTSAPAGWMICDGTSLLRASYPELFAVIGTAFGSADSTHFNIPDMREAVPKGAGLTGKSSNHYDSDGVALGEFINDRMQSHTHVIGCGDVKDGYIRPFIGGGGVATNFTSNSNNGRSGATTEVKSVGVNYIIKAKMVGVPADFMAKVDEAVEDAMGHSKVTIPFSSFVNPDSHLNSQYCTMTWYKFSNFGILQFAILIDSGVAVDTRCMITENVKSLLGITNAWGREEVGIGGIASNDNTSIIGAQATVELRTGNDDLRFRINSSNGGWIRGQLFLSKS